MSFQPSDIRIPYKERQEIPVGMVGSIPVEVRRIDGTLEVGTPFGAIIVSEETPEAIIQTIDTLINFIFRFHPEVLKPT